MTSCRKSFVNAPFDSRSNSSITVRNLAEFLDRRVALAISSLTPAVRLGRTSPSQKVRTAAKSSRQKRDLAQGKPRIQVLVARRGGETSGEPGTACMASSRGRRILCNADGQRQTVEGGESTRRTTRA